MLIEYNDGEGPKGCLSILIQCSNVLCALCTYQVFLAGAFVLTQVWVTHCVQLVRLTSDHLISIALRFPSLELATLEPPRINLTPLPNLSHSCIWPFICNTPCIVQTELFALHPPLLYILPVIWHITHFPLIPLLANDIAIHLLPMQRTWTSLTSLSHSRPALTNRAHKFFLLTSSSLQSQLHLPVTIQKLRVSSQDFWYHPVLHSSFNTRNLPLLFFATLLWTFICNSLDHRENLI